MIKYNKESAAHARQLRRTMTHAEVILWKHLQRKQLLGLRFNRQKPIGPYIADFYCHSVRLVIEVDGGQHFQKDGIVSDKIRDEFMIAVGLTVLRFSNTDVLNNLEGVLSVIANMAKIRKKYSQGI